MKRGRPKGSRNSVKVPLAPFELRVLEVINRDILITSQWGWPQMIEPERTWRIRQLEKARTSSEALLRLSANCAPPCPTCGHSPYAPPVAPEPSPVKP